MAVLASSGAKRLPTKVENEMMRDAFLRKHQQEHVELAEELEHTRRSHALRGVNLYGVA